LGPLRLSLLPWSSKLLVGLGHAGLIGNELGDSITKTGATFLFAHKAYQIYYLKTKFFSKNSLFCQIPSVSSEELALPRLARYKRSPLRCYDTAFY